MGLDMSLRKTKRVSFLSDKTAVMIADEVYRIDEITEWRNGMDDIDLPLYEALLKRCYTYTLFEHIGEANYLFKEVAWWRKANAIHKWFVDNVQDGEDNCESYPVSKDDLNELLSVCERVKANPEEYKSLLPPQEGFFFGTTEYDEWYWIDVDYTICTLKKIIDQTDWENEIVYYWSSW